VWLAPQFSLTGLFLAFLVLGALLGQREAQLILLALGVLWVLYVFRKPLAEWVSRASRDPLRSLRRFLGVLLILTGWWLAGLGIVGLVVVPLGLLGVLDTEGLTLSHVYLVLVALAVGVALSSMGGHLLHAPARARTAGPSVVVRQVAPGSPGRVDYEALEKALKARVIGQDHAVEAVVRGLKRKAAGLTRKEKPFSAMLAGPTGTGKTELAKALAEALGRPLVRYDMNQYGQDHTVAGLVGSPPGYVGSDRPGRLYEDLARHPEAVVLFDEMEKAHPAVLDPLLQLLDEGRFQELSKGLVASAPNAVLLFTTNLLAREAFEGRGEMPEHLLRARLVHMGLRPEFVNRLDVVVGFRPFGEEELKRLARLHLGKYLEDWKRQASLGHLQVYVDEGVYDLVLSQVDPRFGARDLQRAIESLVADPLAEAYLAHGGRPRKLAVRKREDGYLEVSLE